MQLVTRSASLALGLLCMATIAYAQAATPAEPAEPRIRPPALLVQPDADKPYQPLTITNLDVRVTIHGPLVQTTMTMVFANPHDRALEGEFTFPLPEGSTVSGYGLDVEGHIVEAVIVEQQRARAIFESEVRKGIDPGLLEWIAGNTFRTRVFPIPARGSRTVQVSYLAQVVPGPIGESFVLPLNFSEPIARVNIGLDIVGRDRKPTIKQGIGDFDFEAHRDRFVCRAVMEDVKLVNDLVIDLPATPNERGASIAIERDAVDDTMRFLISDVVASEHVAANLDVKRIGLFWDASFSRLAVDKRHELKMLATLMRRLGDVEVDVYVFRNDVEPVRTFAIAGGDATPLTQYLGGLTYDGGTDLAKLRLPARAARDARDYDFHLLFSDGSSNLSALPEPSQRPVFTVNYDTRANHPLLRHIAETSGGTYINLANVPPDDATMLAGQTPYALLKIEVDPAKVAEVYPQGATPVHGHVQVVGQLLAEEAEVTLHLGRAGGAVEKRTYTLRRSEASDDSQQLVPRAWAQRKIESLLVFPEKNRAALTELGQRYSLVTPGTSLLVLESLQQHLEYNVAPHPSRTAMYDDYMKQARDKQAAAQANEAAHLDEVARMWNERVAWWEKQFVYPKDFRFKPVPELGVAAGEAASDPVARLSRREDAARPQGQRNVPPSSPRARPETGHVEGREALLMEEHLRLRVDDADAAAFYDAPSNKATGATPRTGTIQLTPWNPDTPYLKAMNEAGVDGAYDVYLASRKDYAASPAFYLDCADYFFRQQRDDLAVRVLTTVLDLELEDPQLMRIVAHRLDQAKRSDLAAYIFERVLVLRPEEPQSYRDLALVLARLDQRDRAIELLYEVVKRRWDGRFPAIETIALMELNELLARHGGQTPQPIDTRLVKLLDTDLRIVLTWDTDLTDIDLWVIEPSGEKCYYEANRTTIGGYMTKDFTQGYGPEEYFVRTAMPGEYTIMAHYFGSRAQRFTGATTLQATIITNFGRRNETRREVTLRLTDAKERIEIARVRIEGDE